MDDLARWLAKARDIQWDYKNIAKRKGRLVKVKIRYVITRDRIINCNLDQ